MPARVAFVVERFPMLSETFVAAQAAALVHHGMAVDIFASRLEPAGLSHETVIGANLIGRTRFAQPRPPHRAADWLGRPYRLCERLRRQATHANMADPRPYDAVLCHFGSNGLRALDAARRGRLRGPIWTVFHGYDLSQGIDAGNQPYGELFRHGACFLPVSDYWAERLKSFGCPPERIAVHRMGVDCDAIAYRERAGEGPTQFLTVARLIEKKGVEYALRALALLQARSPQIAWRYSIVGDGPLRPLLERLAGELGIAGRVTFHGAQPHAFVRAALDRAHVFVLPSVTASNGDMEGIPVALMEAMAAGLTVASSRHSGIPELVAHGRSGMLAPERDAGALAENLRMLAGDPALQRHLARNARETVLRQFNNATLDRQLVSMIAGEAAGRGIERSAA